MNACARKNYRIQLWMLIVSVCLVLSACSSSGDTASNVASETTTNNKVEQANIEDSESPQEPDHKTTPNSIVDVEFEKAEDGPPILEDKDVTFVLDDGTRITKTVSMTNRFRDILYLDLTGDGRDEVVFTMSFGNTAGEWNLVSVFHLEENDVAQIFPVDNIVELGDQLFDAEIVPCGIQGFPSNMIEVRTRTKSGPRAYTTAHEMLAWQDDAFEIIENYAFSPTERLDDWTVKYQIEGISNALNKMIMDGGTYDIEDAESVWKSIYYCIIGMPEPSYTRLDVTVEYDNGDATYYVSDEVIGAYASALFNGMSKWELPEIPDTIENIAYDSSNGTYMIYREGYDNSVVSINCMKESGDGRYVATVSTASDEKKNSIEMVYEFEENTSIRGSHLFPYGVTDCVDPEEEDQVNPGFVYCEDYTFEDGRRGIRIPRGYVLYEFGKGIPALERTDQEYYVVYETTNATNEIINETRCVGVVDYIFDNTKKTIDIYNELLRGNITDSSIIKLQEMETSDGKPALLVPSGYTIFSAYHYNNQNSDLISEKVGDDKLFFYEDGRSFESGVYGLSLEEYISFMAGLECMEDIKQMIEKE